MATSGSRVRSRAEFEDSDLSSDVRRPTKKARTLPAPSRKSLKRPTERSSQKQTRKSQRTNKSTTQQATNHDGCLGLHHPGEESEGSMQEVNTNVGSTKPCSGSKNRHATVPKALLDETRTKLQKREKLNKEMEKEMLQNGLYGPKPDPNYISDTPLVRETTRVVNDLVSWASSTTREYDTAKPVGDLSGRAKRLLNKVVPKSLDLSIFPGHYLASAVAARVLLKILNYQMKLPGSLTHLSTVMNGLSASKRMNFPEGDPHVFASHYSTKYNELRIGIFDILNDMSEEEKQHHFSQVAQRYTGKIKRIFRNLFRIEKNAECWNGLYDIFKAAVELSFRIKLSRTQYSFHLPDFEQTDELPYGDDYMDSLAGLRRPELEGKPVGLVLFPAMFKCDLKKDGSVLQKTVLIPMRVMCREQLIKPPMTWEEMARKYEEDTGVRLSLE